MRVSLLDGKHEYAVRLPGYQNITGFDVAVYAAVIIQVGNGAKHTVVGGDSDGS